MVVTPGFGAELTGARIGRALPEAARREVHDAVMHVDSAGWRLGSAAGYHGAAAIAGVVIYVKPPMKPRGYAGDFLNPVIVGPLTVAVAANAMVAGVT